MRTKKQIAEDDAYWGRSEEDPLTVLLNLAETELEKDTKKELDKNNTKRK